MAPHGHLYTFEFHAQRASANRDDFVNEGLGDLTTVTHRDACAGGFKTEKLGESGIIATHTWLVALVVCRVCRVRVLTMVYCMRA